MVTKPLFENIAGVVFVIPDPMFPLYLIRGEQSVLVDCGVLGNAETIEKSVGQLLGEDKIHMALITHSHYDHVGACSYLQRTHRFKVVASLRTREVLENQKAISFINHLSQEFMAANKIDSGLNFTRPRDIQTVKEGDRLSISQRQFIQVYETPGHTRCSISYFLLPEKVLFTGDAVGIMEKRGGIRPLFLSSYRQYEASIKKLQGLNAEFLALPHNRFLRGSKNISDFLTRSLEATIHFKDKLLSYLKDSDDFERIAGRILSTESHALAAMGPTEAIKINLMAMIRAVARECTQNN